MTFLGIYQENEGRHLIRLDQKEVDLGQLVMTYPDGQTAQTTPELWIQCERHHYTRVPAPNAEPRGATGDPPVPDSRVQSLLRLLETEGDYELTIEISFDLQQYSAPDAKRSRGMPLPIGLSRPYERHPDSQWAAHYGEFTLECGRRDGRWRSRLLPLFERPDDRADDDHPIFGASLTDWREQDGAGDPLSLLIALLAGLPHGDRIREGEERICGACQGAGTVPAVVV